MAGQTGFRERLARLERRKAPNVRQRSKRAVPSGSAAGETVRRSILSVVIDVALHGWWSVLSSAAFWIMAGLVTLGVFGLNVSPWLGLAVLGFVLFALIWLNTEG